MIRFSSVFLIIVSLVACKSPKDSHQYSKAKSEMTLLSLYERDSLPNGGIRFKPSYSVTAVDTSSIQLDFFTTIPETIPGARELYSYDTTKLASKKYIFLTDLTEYAIVKNNGRDIYLKKQYEKCEMLSENTFKDVFSGNGYTINFIHKKVSHKNGKTYEKGTLAIENAKHKVIINIHGGYEM